MKKDKTAVNKSAVAPDYKSITDFLDAMNRTMRPKMEDEDRDEDGSEDKSEDKSDDKNEKRRNGHVN